LPKPNAIYSALELAGADGISESISWLANFNIATDLAKKMDIFLPPTALWISHRDRCSGPAPQR
jgi:hypothetical protein